MFESLWFFILDGRIAVTSEKIETCYEDISRKWQPKNADFGAWYCVSISNISKEKMSIVLKYVNTSFWKVDKEFGV